MTDLSRGARVRRGGRRPGWVLLTALLVLAIGASSALVFTNRVELLKLAVILALWAAVVAAFVSVIYRRQSDVDQARARDLKLVYDLQLDREISARREYELTVESQLRRELASELSAHGADEVSELRAELAALRTNLEILFDAELSERPALETDPRTVRGYSDWDREHESPRERVNRVTSVRAEEPPGRADDSSIIDVPEEPLVPPPRQPVMDGYQPAAYAYQPAGADEGSGANRAAEAYETPEADGGGRRRRAERSARAREDQATPPSGWAAPRVSAASGAERQYEGRVRVPPEHASDTGGWAASGPSPASGAERFEPQPPRRSHRRPETPRSPSRSMSLRPPRSPSRHRNCSGPDGRRLQKRQGIKSSRTGSPSAPRGIGCPPKHLAAIGIPVRATAPARRLGHTTTRLRATGRRTAHRASANPRRRLSSEDAIPAPPPCRPQARSANPRPTGASRTVAHEPVIPRNTPTPASADPRRRRQCHRRRLRHRRHHRQRRTEGR